MSDLYIGLMSGTSVDAIDAVVCNINPNSCQLIASSSIALPTELQQKIHALSCSQYQKDPILEFGELDTQLGHVFADAAQKLLAKAKIKPEQIKAIGSHGQTVRHHPELENPFSLQIGDANIIAAKTGITTVADFRRRDIALGGQGAPLVPAFHQAVFSSKEHTRVVLNLGGIANISLLEPNQPILGYDTGPANTLMDQWIAKHKSLKFDRDGQWAQQGQLDKKLLDKLLSHHYFSQAAPKSTGRESFNLEWLESQLDNQSTQDVQATLLELTARSVCQSITSHSDSGELFICGGGAHNKALVDRISELLPQWNIQLSSKLGIDPDWVEAMAFAWLAYRTLNQQTGNLATVTGASKDSILGAIYPA